MRYLLPLLAFLIGSLCFADAMDEVNACRRANRLPPLVRDATLMQGAQDKAEWQAYYQTNKWNGYPSGHDGPGPPPGIREGTAQRSSPQAGWASCLMAVPGSHRAGAGVALDTNGNKYMVLWIRGNPPNERIVPQAVSTTHLNPNPPVIQKASFRVKAKPGPYITYSPYNYSNVPGPPKQTLKILTKTPSLHKGLLF